MNEGSVQSAQEETPLERLKLALTALAINRVPDNGIPERSEERTAIVSFLDRRLSTTSETTGQSPSPDRTQSPEGSEENQKETSNQTKQKPQDKHVPGCLYVCGPVGTGKTILVNELVSSYDGAAIDIGITEHSEAEGSSCPPKRRRSVVSVHKIDCVADAAAESVRSAYEWFAERLCNEKLNHNKIRRLKDTRLRKFVDRYVRMNTLPPVIVVMDEADDILDLAGGAAFLRQLFEWAATPKSRLILVAIGNNMQLIDEFATAYAALLQRNSGASNRAQKRPVWLPPVLRFSAYSQESISSILRARVGQYRVISPPALQLIAMKAESMGGDIRTAIAMCREPLLRAYMEYQRTGNLPTMPLTPAQVSPVVSELVDDTRAVISGLTSLQKQFLAALFSACAFASVSEQNEQFPPVFKQQSSQKVMLPQQARLIPATKISVYSCYLKLCSVISASTQCLSMLVLFRECVGALTDLNFIHTVGTDKLELTVDGDDLFAALLNTDPLVHRALNQCLVPILDLPEEPQNAETSMGSSSPASTGKTSTNTAALTTNTAADVAAHDAYAEYYADY